MTRSRVNKRARMVLTDANRQKDLDVEVESLLVVAYTCE